MTQQISELIAALGPPSADGDLGQLGAYRILRVLGHGGMGVVFVGRDSQLERCIAIKAMLPEVARNAGAGERFVREAKAMAQVRHPNVATIYQVGDDRGIPYIAMELLEGESLEARLVRERTLPTSDILRIGRQVAEALDASHKLGLIHRDVKPANIWLESSEHVKILDFGLARSGAPGSSITRSGIMVGTPGYLSPEQAGGGPVSPRSDLFGLGVVLYRCCTGQLPFLGDDAYSTLMAIALEDPTPPQLLNFSVSEPLSDLILKLLDKNPNQRYGSAQELIADLSRIEKDPDAPLPRGSPPSDVPDPYESPPVVTAAGSSPRRRWPIAAALVLLALGGVGIVAWQYTLTLRDPHGELVVQVNDPAIEVTIRQDGLEVEDRSTKRSFRLKPGAGEIEFFEPASGARFATQKFTIQRGESTRLGAAYSPVPKLAPAPAALVSKPPPAAVAAPRDRFAIFLDGKSGRIRIPKQSFKYYGQHPLTIEAIVIPHGGTTSARQELLCDYAGASGLGLARLSDDRWAFALNIRGELIGAVNDAPVVPEKRVHLAAVYDEPRNKIRMFVDGKLGNSEVSLDEKFAVTPWDLILGADPENPGNRFKHFFHGTLEQFRLSRTARYARDYTPPTSLEADAESILLYRFREGEGNIVRDSIGNRDAILEQGHWVVRDESKD